MWVIGGSRGIGLNVAKLASCEGHEVVISGRCEKRLRLVAGDGWHVAECDVVDRDSVDCALDSARRGLTRIPRHLVFAAGVSLPGLVARLSDASVREIVDTNVVGAVNCARAFIRGHLAAGSAGEASIVLVGSTVGASGAFPGSAVYAASKGAVHSLAAALAREYGRAGLRVNAVAPGYVATDMTEGVPEVRRAFVERAALGREVAAEDVASAVLCLAKNRSISGTTLFVDAGFSA